MFDKQELLITQYPDFAKYMFKFIRDLSENKINMQLIVGKGLNFEYSFIESEYFTPKNKNLSKTLDKRKKAWYTHIESGGWSVYLRRGTAIGWVLNGENNSQSRL